MLTYEQTFEGTFSFVKYAVDTVRGVKTAIKCIPVSGKEDEERCARARVESEIAVLTSMRGCANVVQLLDHFTSDTSVYLVLERLTGGDLLDSLVSKGRYDEEQGRAVVRSVLLGLKACHDINVVHRDLKAEHFVWSSSDDNNDRELKICGFSMACVCMGDASLTDVCGTPQYVAPEVLQQIPYGKGVDMWSVGVFAYMVLSGCHPFVSDFDEAEEVLFDAIVRGEYDLESAVWESVSESAKGFLRGLLALDPLHRMTVDQALSHTWVCTYVICVQWLHL